MEKLRVYLDTSVIDYTLIQIDDNVVDIAQQIIEMGILTKKAMMIANI